MRWSVLILVTLCPLLASTARAQPPAASLPPLALDAFPPVAREPIGRAWREAEARPTDADVVGALGRTLHAWEQWEAARAVYARAQSLAPAAFAWVYLDCVVLQRLARHADAAACLQRALALDPSYLAARVKLTEALFDAGMPDDAERLALALVDDPASEPVGRLVLGRVAAARGRHDEAVTQLQRAQRLYPQWGAAHYALALSYRALGRQQDARQALQLHARYGPQWPSLDDPMLAAVAAIREDGRALLDRAIAIARRGDVAGAITAHEAALQREPTLFQAHANLIALYGQAGNWQQADAHYRAALSLGGEVGGIHYDYGVLLGLQQRWGEAIDAYRRAIEVDPGHAVAHNNLGEALERTGQLRPALEAYREAVTLQPGFRVARFNTGRLLVAVDAAAEAVAMLEPLAESRDAEAPRFLLALGVACLRAGRREDGVRWVNEAHRLAVAHGQSDLAAAIARDLAAVR